MQIPITEILEKIKEVRITVYGDFCLDVYWEMDQAGSEISVETGRQAEAVTRHYYSPGGAGNVVANMAALEPKLIKAVGIVGNDMYGRELTSQLNHLGVDTEALIKQNEDFHTYAFNKKYLDGGEEARIDFGIHNRRSPATDAEVLDQLRRALETSDVLVFNQQVPGSINNETFIAEAKRLFAEFPGKVILLDSRHLTERFGNVSLKLNEIEAARLNGIPAGYQDYIPTCDIEKYGLAIFKKYQKPIFVTCGQRGILAVDRRGIHKVPGIQLDGPMDTVGAGDTVLSALALCLGAGYSTGEAAHFANFAAAVSIQKVQTTGTATGEEILTASRDADFIYQPELAQNLHQAVYFPQTEIEYCEEDITGRLGQVRHAVFDHDGTISTLRQGWEQVMEPIMLEAILGDQLSGVNGALYEKVRRRCVEYIDQSTGIQTIIQMEALARMVDEFNIVPKDQILDKFGYKERYNDALLEMVNKRIAKFQSGELQVEDVTIKGAVALLHALKERGVTLYLASGTDRDDVVREAEMLGYAHLFEGRIHGSVGDIRQYSKKMVIDQIIREHQLKGNELAVLGDGPVEIREGRRFGGIAVGIASDEPRRYGLNPEKRKRLIRAGAHIIIPDFSQGERLMELLMGI